MLLMHRQIGPTSIESGSVRASLTHLHKLQPHLHSKSLPSKQKESSLSSSPGKQIPRNRQSRSLILE